ncbi:hypothetical protein Tco_0512902, partial [Tanacetum coccineum]
QQVVWSTPAQLGHFYLETCGYDRRPETYYGTPLERGGGMFSGRAKEKKESSGDKPSNTRRSRKARESRNNEGVGTQL